jgi:hypothetical protein
MGRLYYDGMETTYWQTEDLNYIQEDEKADVANQKKEREPDL